MVIAALIFIFGGAGLAFLYDAADNMGYPTNQNGGQQATSSLVFVDNSKVAITFTGSSFAYMNGTVFEIAIENKDTTRVWLLLSDMRINGSTRTYAEIEDSDIPPRSTYTGLIYFENVSSLRDLDNITGTLEVYDSRTNSRLGSYQIRYSYRLSV